MHGFDLQRSSSRDDSDDGGHHRDYSESSFSHSPPSIPIRDDRSLNVVNLEEVLRNFELDREAKQGASWSDYGQEVRVSFITLRIISSKLTCVA